MKAGPNMLKMKLKDDTSSFFNRAIIYQTQNPATNRVLIIDKAMAIILQTFYCMLKLVNVVLLIDCKYFKILQIVEISIRILPKYIHKQSITVFLPQFFILILQFFNFSIEIFESIFRIFIFYHTSIGRLFCFLLSSFIHSFIRKIRIFIFVLLLILYRSIGCYSSIAFAVSITKRIVNSRNSFLILEFLQFCFNQFFLFFLQIRIRQIYFLFGWQEFCTEKLRIFLFMKDSYGTWKVFTRFIIIFLGNTKLWASINRKLFFISLHFVPPLFVFSVITFFFIWALTKLVYSWAFYRIDFIDQLAILLEQSYTLFSKLFILLNIHIQQILNSNRAWFIQCTYFLTILIDNN